MLWRTALLALLFSLELTSLSIWLDGDTLAWHSGLASLAHDWGPWILRVVVGFAALFGICVWIRNKHVVEQLDEDLRTVPVQWRLLAGHAASMGLFAALSSVMFNGASADRAGSLLIPVWCLTGVGAIGAGALAILPGFGWRRIARGNALPAIGILAAVVVSCVAGNASRNLWDPTTRLTYGLVHWMLTPFFQGIVADMATMTLGTARFAVEIAPQCSGFEGMALITAFGAVWLFLFRRECRFPQALLLIPGGILLIFLLNAVRIAALIAIGDRGAEQIALGGFHSQAGRIAFNVIALGFSASARHIPWITRERPCALVSARGENTVAPWVLPFVVILATGMLSRAVSVDFEWLYPLRFFAAATTLWVFRKKYMALDWRVGWSGPLAGAAVFATWILLDNSRTAAPEMTPAALTAAPDWARIGWLGMRALAARVTVPIAEELAFRGFLMRRLISADFESVPLSKLSLVALVGSSVLFGLLHGDRWLAGSAAGLLYGWVMVRRGRIGEAVAAHAVTNGLIALDVLLYNQWHLW